MSYDTLDNAPTMDSGDHEGRLLANRYRIVRKLGEGGMGMVYLAVDTELADHSVAIKFIPPMLAGNARAVKNLKREALTAMQLSHPNIVRLHDVRAGGVTAHENDETGTTTVTMGLAERERPYMECTMVDMSGIIQNRLEKALAQARSLADQGQAERAAAAYGQAAKLMRQHARSASSARIRDKRLADADKLDAQAEQLKEGNGRPQTESLTTAEHQGDTEQDGYLAQARGLITQARVTWNEIAGLDEIKRFVKESYALSLARRPEGVGLPRTANLLLYGPPGTGKTLIAAAVSHGLEATFYNCKVSDILSKYFGESTKLVNAVFEVAQETAPSVIFLDDFESIVPSRDGDSSGPERRVLTEILTCMDGFANKNSDRMVLVVAATNKPWLIDSAVLSRFGKLAYVNLPDRDARERIFEILLTERGYAVEGGSASLAELTEGFSGREIEQITKELIRLMVARANPHLAKLAEQGKAALENYTLQLEPIRNDDMREALSRMAPMTRPEELAEYERWGA